MVSHLYHCRRCRVRSHEVWRVSISVLLALPVALSTVSANDSVLDLDQARRFAREHRFEILAARARAQAAQQRPAMVSALDDPMLSPSIDHYPDREMAEDAAAMDSEPDPMEGEAAASEDGGRRYDWSVTLEQRFPMSRLLTHRRHAAEADAERLQADAQRVVLDVEQDAVKAYVMLFEARQMAQLAREQEQLARQLVSAASSRYSSANGTQAEVLRAEVESARANAAIKSRDADLRAAGAMFNTSLARPVDTALPELRSPVSDALPAALGTLRDAALRQRPELQAGRAEIARAGADTAAMRSMYLPMGMVRLGRASTMAEGPGTMAMVGISLPIWTSRLRAGVAEAEAMSAMAQADVEAMRRMVEGETAAAREAVVGAREQYLALRDEIVPRADMALAPAQTAYASGQGSLTALIETAQALWMARTDLVMSQSTLALAWARLRRATGEPGDAP